MLQVVDVFSLFVFPFFLCSIFGQPKWALLKHLKNVFGKQSLLDYLGNIHDDFNGGKQAIGKKLYLLVKNSFEGTKEIGTRRWIDF